VLRDASMSVTAMDRFIISINSNRAEDPLPAPRGPR